LSKIPDLERQFLHCQVAEALEAMYPDDRQYDEPLLKHWHYAGDLDKELHYLNLVIQEYINVHSIYPEAQKLLERSLDKLPENEPRAVHLWYWQSILHWRFNEFDEAEVLLRYAYPLAEAHNDRHGMARCLSGLGLIMNFQDRFEEAEEAFTKSIALFRTLHDCAGLGLALVQIGGLYYDLGDYPKAMDWLLASLGQYGKCNDAWGIALSQVMIGLVLIRQNAPELPDIMMSGLEVAHQMMSFPLMLLVLGGYAQYWIQAGEPCYAAQIAGLMSHYSNRVPSSTRKLNEVLLPLQTMLEAETLEAEMAKGCELDLDKIVQDILVSYKT
jgi:tetratricopeptide (TPR) repeat protein